MIILDTTQRRQAAQRHGLLPNLLATNPAVPELRKAPRVMSDEMSCWTTGVRFQPLAAFADG